MAKLSRDRPIVGDKYDIDMTVKSNSIGMAFASRRLCHRNADFQPGTFTQR